MRRKGALSRTAFAGCKNHDIHASPPDQVKLLVNEPKPNRLSDSDNLWFSLSKAKLPVCVVFLAAQTLQSSTATTVCSHAQIS
jgi:hypothetical protein